MGEVDHFLRKGGKSHPKSPTIPTFEIETNWSAIGANGPNWHRKAIVNETTSCNFNTFFNLKLPCWFMLKTSSRWCLNCFQHHGYPAGPILWNSPKKSGSNTKKGCRWRDYSLVIHPEKSPQVPNEFGTSGEIIRLALWLGFFSSRRPPSNANSGYSHPKISNPTKGGQWPLGNSSLLFLTIGLNNNNTSDIITRLW